MPRYAAFALVIATGLLVGMAIRSALTPPVDRSAVMAQLFESFCIGALRGKPLDPQPSLKPANLQGEQIWFEPNSLLHLSLNLPETCSVSDALRPLSASDKKRLAKAVSDSISLWTPELSPREPDDLNFFILKAWTTPDDHPKPRWGIMLSQYEETGPNAFAVLSLRLPND